MDGWLRRKPRKPKSSESFREEKKNFYHFPLEPCFKFLITKEGKREEEEMCFGVSINRVHRTNKNCLEFYSGYEISTGIKIDVH